MSCPIRWRAGISYQALCAPCGEQLQDGWSGAVDSSTVSTVEARGHAECSSMAAGQLFTDSGFAIVFRAPPLAFRQYCSPADDSDWQQRSVKDVQHSHRLSVVPRERHRVRGNLYDSNVARNDAVPATTEPTSASPNCFAMGALLRRAFLCARWSRREAHWLPAAARTAATDRSGHTACAAGDVTVVRSTVNSQRRSLQRQKHMWHTLTFVAHPHSCNCSEGSTAQYASQKRGERARTAALPSPPRSRPVSPS